jgi:lipoprotein-releasing system permease protein
MSQNQRYLAWMAWRYLSSSQGRSISVMTRISIAGVVIGVAALVVVLSVMGGFERDLRAKMFRGLPHLEIYEHNPMVGLSLQSPEVGSLLQRFTTPTSHIEPFTKADVILKSGKHLASSVLFGIDPKEGGQLWGFFTYESDLDLPQALDTAHVDPTTGVESLAGVALGAELAMQLGVNVGDAISIINPYGQQGLAIFDGAYVLGIFTVVEIFQTDLPQFDTKYAVTSLRAGRRYLPEYDFSLDEEGYVSGLAVNFSDPEQASLAAATLSQNHSLSVQTWKDTNHSLLVALKLEKFTMGAILLLIVLVAAFSISGTVMMTVFHKRSQIALLKALGMSRRDVAWLFVNVGLFIGTVGVLAGLLLGLGGCLTLHLLANMGVATNLPVKFLPLEYVVICASAWMLSLLAALYPALMASQQDPGDGLRCL